ncbi:MAG: hypothetical protein A2Y56_11455 [Candidatus Aminicenantes bacterium RBG_13_63_10]|nr:MAG: hypothetical protein A2Y56_11455 [Candidatus Aminicenantes bacterium RBG_13_63_10]
MTPTKPALSIEVKMTNLCNQECGYCANNDGAGPPEMIDWRAFNGRLEEWAGQKETSVCDLTEVRLTGGEPLLHFEGVVGIARCCQRLGIRSGINTNGLLLDAARIRLLKACGLEVLKISYDSLRAETYSQVRYPIASLRPLTRTIREAVENRFKVILRLTLAKPNRGQLVECSREAAGLGVYKLQIKPLIRSGRAAGLDQFLSREEIEEALARLAESAAGGGLPVEVLCWPPAPGSPFSYKICGNINKIYVSTDLTCTICNYIGETDQARLGDLALTPLEVIFRRRLDESLNQSVNGCRLVRGCPNTAFFEGGAP